VQGRWVRLLHEGRGISASSCSEEATLSWKWLEQYLQLEVDLDAVIASFPKDEHLEKAVKSCPGLRLLRQDPWECLASFILSSTKQIVQIRQIVSLICERFGERVPAPAGRAGFSFPSPETIAHLTEADLRCCKMGFRAPYLKGTAQMILRGEVRLNGIAKMALTQARAELMRLPGVGRKIADCVLLFAYGFQEAFPIDVWVLKAIRQLYFHKRRPKTPQIIHFAETHFGPNAGYAQQYLFHYMRTRVGRSKPT
jgi:N-glycosylase/DNA lyase